MKGESSKQIVTTTTETLTLNTHLETLCFATSSRQYLNKIRLQTGILKKAWWTKRRKGKRDVEFLGGLPLYNRFQTIVSRLPFPVPRYQF